MGYARAGIPLKEGLRQCLLTLNAYVSHRPRGYSIRRRIKTRRGQSARRFPARPRASILLKEGLRLLDVVGAYTDIEGPERVFH